MGERCFYIKICATELLKVDTLKKVIIKCSLLLYDTKTDLFVKLSLQKMKINKKRI